MSQSAKPWREIGLSLSVVENLVYPVSRELLGGRIIFIYIFL